MQATRRSTTSCWLTAAAALWCAVPAAADWLQMRDGSRVETRGSWEVRGAQIVFTLPNGTFASTRTDAVDLDASRRLTEESQRPKPVPTPAPPKKPVLVLTDSDLPRATKPAAPPVSEGSGGASASTAAAAATDPPAASPPGAAAEGDSLKVVAWSSRYSSEQGATVLGGTLRNGGDTLRYDLKVVVSIFDRAGGLLAKSDAELSAPGLPPGGSTTFEVRYPGSLDIADAKFEIAGERASLQRPPPAPGPAPTPDPTTLHPVGDGSEPSRLAVSSWQPEKVEGSTTVTLVGDLVNNSAETAYDVRLRVTLLDVQGATLAGNDAMLGAVTLLPGQTTKFRISFPGVEQYQDVRFEARGTTRIRR